ncbi:MAG: hypothetical protein K6G29_02595 [Clostridiales bacterium]|nr:hypothetical protein [Clostridiales bacterium]
MAPSYDPDTGVLRCVAAARADVGDYIRFRYTCLEVTEDGIQAEVPLRVAEDVRLESVLYVGDVLYVIEADDRKSILRRVDPKTGEADGGTDIKPFFRYSSGDYYYIQNFISGADGNLFFFSYPEILVLSPKLEKLCSVQVNSVNGMAADEEGRVWIWGNLHNGLAMAEVIPGSGSLGTPLDLPTDTRGILFAPGHDLYVMTDNGIDGYDYTEEGMLPEDGEEVVSFLNSDIGLASTRVIKLYSSEMFLASESGVSVPVLYKHAADVDLSAVRTVRVAISTNGFVEDTIRMKIVLFNRSRTDIRIEVDDYTPKDGVWGDELYDNENRLALGITTGTYKPDLVICMQNGPVYKVGAEQGWFRDLTSFTERPGLLNRNNILGCVKRTYTDRDGRLFALTDRFNITGTRGNGTFLSTPEALGVLADKGTWMLAEFLDFAENLPEDVVLMENLTRENAPYELLGAEGYAAFIDWDGSTCHFDDGVFARYLYFLAALPTVQEYRTHSPYDLVNLDRVDKYPYYRDGKIALAGMSIRSLEEMVSMESVFGTKDWVMIGRPADTGYGTTISGRAVFAMTAEDDHAVAAWEALEAIMTPASVDRYEDGITSFADDLRAEMDSLMQQKYYIRYGGRGITSTAKSREWWEGYDQNPGMETEFTEEDAARFYDLFENKLGVPYSPAVSEDVTDIVEEEISAFLGGIGTADDCAAKIQSRVSIWLAEHR